MLNIPRKVLISCHHAKDQYYKTEPVGMRDLDCNCRQYAGVFRDYSVLDKDIDDSDMTSEQMRCAIRDGYMREGLKLAVRPFRKPKEE